MSDTSGDCGCGCAPDSPEATDTIEVGAPMSGALDVRTLPHGDRHDIIFDKLEQLDCGQSLVIVNDHDPKPLRYQMEALWPERFSWSYLETGPEQWRVEISHAG